MELLFVSGSHNHFSLSQPRCNYKLSNGLPRPHSAKPWNQSKVSPLRDRLMIDWLFSHREALKELYNIVTFINKTIEKSSSKVSLNMMEIAISCEDGFELSPCYVEKLYDHYKTNPPIDNLLLVKREHVMPDNKQIPTRRLKWQQYSGSTLLYRRRTENDSIQQIKSVTTSREWFDMPQELSANIEEAYNKDPLSNNARLNSAVVDFESGHMTLLLTKQTALIRCSVTPKDYKVKVRAINHQVYKMFIHSFDAAGILPYSVHPVTGEAVFLVGRLTYGGGTWCDFGGLKTRYRITRETPAQTAARECYEESLGVFGSSDQLLHCLRNYQENNVFKIINEDKGYVGHYLRLPFDHYPSKFATRVLDELGRSNVDIEVESMRWIPLSSLRRAIGQAQLSTSSFVKVQPINESDGSLDSISLRLRIEFVESLCIADEFGILDFIENIAAMIHSGVNQQSVKEQVKDSPAVITEQPSSVTDGVIQPLIDDMVTISIDNDQSKDKTILKTEEYIKSTDVAQLQVIKSPTTLSTNADGDGVSGATALCPNKLSSSHKADRHHDSPKRHGHLLYGMISGSFSLIDSSDIF